MSNYTTDGKGNVYDTRTGKRVWSGDPQDVITLFEETDRLNAESNDLYNQLMEALNAGDTLEKAWKEQRQMTNEWMIRALEADRERDEARAETERIRQLAFSMADAGFEAIHQRDQLQAELDYIATFEVTEEGEECLTQS